MIWSYMIQITHRDSGYSYLEVTADVDGWFRYPEWNSFIVKWPLSCKTEEQAIHFVLISIYIDSRHVSLYHVFSIEICHLWRWLRPRNSKTNLNPPHQLLLGRLYIYQLHITQFPSHLVWHLNLGKPRVRWFHIKGVFFWNTVYFKRIKSRNFMFLFALLVAVFQDKLCLKAKLYLSKIVISPRAGNFFLKKICRVSWSTNGQSVLWTENLRFSCCFWRVFYVVISSIASYQKFADTQQLDH